MENPLIATDQEFIWEVMSEFFVDNEIDYDYWAAKIARFPLDALKEIFFSEVAPVCGPNVLTPIPPIWLAFDTGWTINEIRSRLSRRKDSLMYRLRHDTSVLYYRIRCRDIWAEIESAVMRSRAKH